MVRKGTLFLLSLLMVPLGATVSPGTTRKPAVAGAFYPDDPQALSRLVNQHLTSVTDSPEINGRIIALIVPHAGLVYSGQIAAHSYKLLEGSGVNTAVLCGPSHRHGFHGASVYGPDVTWRTPLGNVRCNAAICRRLIEADKQIQVVPEAHHQEHSLEVQLPYLQTVLEDFSIVPIVMGYYRKQTVEALAEVLSRLDVDERTVLVASTDWQHYHPASVGWKMDSLGLECLRTLDGDRLTSYLEKGRVEACGGGPAAAVIKAAVALGADKVKILRYGDSGDVTGDKSSVVSYVAAVLYDSTPGEKNSPSRQDEEAEKETHADGFQLSRHDKEVLLQIARQSIESHLSSREPPSFDVSDNLRQPGAAFVTLEKNGRLRGCIGHTQAVQPLFETVATCAVSAAVSDYRFQPVTRDEIANLHIEISVLTPLQVVESLEEIAVGRDGLMIVKGSRRGLLLPQVAVDYGWSRSEFLEHTCRKAGLPSEAYKSPDAVIYRFQAVIFKEE